MKTVRRWLPVILIAVIIYLLSDIPKLHLYDNRTLPPLWRELVQRYTIRIGATGFFSYVISPHPDFILHKLGHMAVYGALGVVSFFAAKRAGLAVLLSVLYAVADEIHQGFVVGRSSRFGDIVLDAVAAVAAIWLVKQYLQKREQDERRRSKGSGEL